MKELEKSYDERLHDLEVQTGRAERHLEYVKGEADGHEQRAKKYQKEAAENRNAASVASAEFNSWNRKVQTRKKQCEELERRIEVRNKALGISDSIDEGNRELIRVASEIEQNFESAEDVSIAFNHYTDESQNIVEHGVEMVRGVTEVIDALEASDVEVPEPVRNKVKELGKSADKFIDTLKVFDIAFERVRNVFQNTALYKVTAERLKKDKEDFKEAVKETSKPLDKDGWSIGQNGTLEPNTSAYEKAERGGVGVDREMSL